MSKCNKLCSPHFPPPQQMGRRHVIPGVEKGLMGACVGEKRRIIIPPALAYGPNGDGGVIPPDATIAFEIDIFEIYIKGMLVSLRLCLREPACMI